MVGDNEGEVGRGGSAGRGQSHEHESDPGHDRSQLNEHENGHGHAPAEPTGPRDPREIALEAFVEELSAELAERDPVEVARLVGAAYDPDERQLELRVYGKLFAVSYPSLDLHELAADHHTGTLWVRVLLAHYFRTADGSPREGRWVTLRDLPGGLMYERAFQGYSGDELARGFGPDFAQLREVARFHGGVPLALGDLGFSIDVLPRVPIAVVCYEGDDEQPASARLLFDASAVRYLPTDALATLGGRLTRLLLHAGGVTGEPAKPITPGWLGR